MTNMYLFYFHYISTISFQNSWVDIYCRSLARTSNLFAGVTSCIYTYNWSPKYLSLSQAVLQTVGFWCDSIFSRSAVFQSFTTLLLWSRRSLHFSNFPTGNTFCFVSPRLCNSTMDSLDNLNASEKAEATELQRMIAIEQQKAQFQAQVCITTYC